MPITSKGGIYAIKNITNGKQYIGSAVDVYARLKKHRSALRLGNHSNRHLLNAWKKYGEQSFEMGPLVWCDATDLICVEQRAIATLKPKYNISPTAGSNLGLQHSLLELLQMRTKHLLGGKKKRGRKMGYVTSPETKEKLSIVGKGRKYWKEPLYMQHTPLKLAKMQTARKSPVGRSAAQKDAWRRRRLQYPPHGIIPGRMRGKGKKWHLRKTEKGYKSG